jgi:hypothetical protein
MARKISADSFAKDSYWSIVAVVICTEGFSEIVSAHEYATNVA